MPTGLNAATLIGDKVTVEPYAVLRSCRVESKCIIGARSVLCEGSIVESESIVAPNSVVPPARRIPSGELWGGNPAKFIRKLTAHEVNLKGFNWATAGGKSWDNEGTPLPSSGRDWIRRGGGGVGTG